MRPPVVRRRAAGGASPWPQPCYERGRRQNERQRAREHRQRKKARHPPGPAGTLDRGGCCPDEPDVGARRSSGVTGNVRRFP